MGVLSGSAVEETPASDATCFISGFFQLVDDNTIKEQAQSIIREVDTKLSELFSCYGQKMMPLETELFDDQNWATSWQQFFSSFEIIPGMVIKPSWEEYEQKQGELIIEMDPGMAFGTGQHASTRMALSLLSRCAGKDTEKILDIGTGTGILAIGGCLMGIKKGVAIDNDPDAVKAASENVAKNNLASRIVVSDKQLDKVEGSYSIICANIIHDVLVDMANEISRLCPSGGSIILAGILQGEQEQNIVDVYQQLGFMLVKTEHQDEWAALLFRRQS
jgi:ribosomal protein L11 methyltransferase